MDYYPPMGVANSVLHLTVNQPPSVMMSETYILLQRACRRENPRNGGV